MTTITPTAEELQILEALRAHRRNHRKGFPSKISHHLDGDVSGLTIGQKISDVVARTVGSWKFILLNLMLSFQAAYTALVIMMSQNRLSEIDRQQASNDFEVNVMAELEIELLHQKIDLLKERELFALTQSVEALREKLDGMRK